MKILLRSLTLATAAFSPAVHASESLFAATPLTDAELDEARGGFTLPGGATIDIGAIITTSINGVKVLTSQLNVNSSGVTGSVQAGSGVQATVAGAGTIAQTITNGVKEAVGEITASIGELTGSLGGQDMSGGGSSGDATQSVGSLPATTPTIITNPGQSATDAANGLVSAATDLATDVQNQTAGAVDTATSALAGVTDNVAASINNTGPLANSSLGTTIASNLQPGDDLPDTTVPLASSAGAAGAITVPTVNMPSSATTVDGSTFLTSTVQMQDLLVKHSIGTSISSLVVNTTDNRIIDTQLAVNLRLDNVQPLSLGSIGFQIDALGVDASAMRAGR